MTRPISAVSPRGSAKLAAMTSPTYRPAAAATATIAAVELDDWAAHAESYPPGPPGIAWQRLDGSQLGEHGRAEALVWRDDEGLVRGTCVYFPHPPPTHGDGPGAIYLWTQPEWRGRGIARALLNEALDWWELRVEGQRYTAAGAGFVNDFVQQKLVEYGDSPRHPA